MRNFLLTLLIATFTIAASNKAMGQANENIDMLVQDTKSDLMIVVGGGLAGAVLGLSTLSFVEEPKEHTRNIIVGASLGIIVGVGYVAFSQATRTQNMMYPDEEEGYGKLNIKEFGTSRRVAWHQGEFDQKVNPILSPYSVGFNLKF